MKENEQRRRLRALRQSVRTTLSGGDHTNFSFFNPLSCLNLFTEFAELRDDLIRTNSSLFVGFPKRAIPTPFAGTDFDGAGYIVRADIEVLMQDIERCAVLLGLDLESGAPSRSTGQARWWEKAWVYKLLSFVLALGLGLQSCAQHQVSGDLDAATTASALRQGQMDRMRDYVQITTVFAGIKNPDSLVAIRPEVLRQIEVINADLNDGERVLAKREGRSPRYYNLPSPGAPARVLDFRAK